MKIFLLVIFLILELNANDYIKSNTCKACHPTIYSEFYNSSHRKSSIHEDPIHKAVWNLHPNKKDEKYTCAKCHTPTDLELLNNLKNDKKALPIKNEVQTQEAISCVYCHSIKNIEEHSKVNDNKLTDKNKVYYSANEENKKLKDKKFKNESSMFGMMKKKSGSPFHHIDYSNKDYYTGKMCMGCHNKLQNNNSFNLCKVDMKAVDIKEEKNCISCHMPKVEGSATSIKITKTHRFHGFSSSTNNQDLLAKYIKIDFKQNLSNFEVSIKNEATHNLFLQPLRVAMLKISILKDSKVIKKEERSFVRIIGKDGKATMPWLANSEVKNTMIKAKEKRVLTFDYKLDSSNTVEVVFGYYKVNPKVLKKLKLENHKESTTFNVLKSEFYKAQ